MFYQLSIDAGCHIQHFLFSEQGALSLDTLDQFLGDSGLACSICDYGQEILDQPGLIAFYVEQPDAAAA